MIQCFNETMPWKTLWRRREGETTKRFQSDFDLHFHMYFAFFVLTFSETL